MLLVSESDWNKMKKLYDEKKITSIHSKSMDLVKEKALPPDQYIKAYSTLKDRQEYKNLKQPEVKIDDKVSSYIEDAIQLLPKSYKTRASQIFRFLQQHKPIINWTTKGELETIEHGVVQGSNLIDLISYITSPQAKDIQKPIGLDIFLDILKKVNLPMTMLSRHGVGVINKKVDNGNDDEEVFYDSWFQM